MRSAPFVTAAVLLTFGAACARTGPSASQLSPAVSSGSVLRADRLQRMPGSTAFDALETMPIYMGRKIRQPAPRFVLVLDGMRTSNFELLRSIQASDVFELRVIGESQSIDDQGEVEIVVTTIASHAGSHPRIG